MRLRSFDGRVHSAADVDGTTITGCHYQVGDDDTIVPADTPVTCTACADAAPKPRRAAHGFSHA